jgi:hypothetical protein
VDDRSAGVEQADDDSTLVDAVEEFLPQRSPTLPRADRV